MNYYMADDLLLIFERHKAFEKIHQLDVGEPIAFGRNVIGWQLRNPKNGYNGFQHQIRGILVDYKELTGRKFKTWIDKTAQILYVQRIA